MSKFSHEFAYKYYLLEFHLSQKRNAETLTKYLEACYELRLKNELKRFLEIYQTNFGNIPPQFKVLNFTAPRVNKEMYEKLIEKLESLKIEENKFYYLTTVEWLKNLIENPEASDVSLLEEPIDQDILFDPDPNYWEENFQIKAGLIENNDFVILDEDLFAYFKEKNGGIYIKRASYTPNDKSDPLVEIRLKKYNIKFSNANNQFYFYSSHTRSLDELKQKISRILKFRNIHKEYKLWKESPNGSISNFENTDFGEEDKILVDIKDKYGKFSFTASKKEDNISSALKIETRTNGNSKSKQMEVENDSKDSNDEKMGRTEYFLLSMKDSISQLKKLEVRCGKVGLQNLGNTCFMNSALQCLSNSFELTNYFLKGLEKDDINLKNPLGTKGVLAVCYAELMKSMWLGKSNSISPWEVKKAIGKHAHQFVGYGQQDSHEFLSYLLDLLHEDLNLVKNKPYIEVKDYDGSNDEKDSLECWNNFKLRNDSVVTSLFYGQYKSTVTCLKCKKVSVNYDPYNVLSLPIGKSHGNEKGEQIIVYLISNDISKPTYKLARICQDSVYSCLVSAAKQLKFEFPIFVEVSNFKIKSLVKPNSSLSEILKSKTNLLVYEGSKQKDILIKMGFSIETKKFEEISFKMIPKIFWVEKSISLNDIYNYASEVISIFLKPKSKDDILDNIQIYVLTGKHFVNLFSQTDSSTCSFCERYNCLGCLLQRSDSSLGSKFLGNEISLNVSISSEIDLKNYDLINIKNEVESNLENPKGNSLFDCISLFTEPEILDENNSYYCSNCKDLKQVSKSLEIMRVPEVLIIHLNRFKVTKKSYSFFGGGTSTTKISKEIFFQLKGLNLTNSIKLSDGSETYDLFAVSNHYGGMGGGHYTAYAKNIVDEKWYDFNDSRVSEISEKGVVSAAAYLLFYRKRRNN